MVIVIFAMYTYAVFMEKQTRKFTLGEVNTRMGTMGEVQFDPALLDVLSVKPGDFLVFTISPNGAVTVTGEKKPPSQQAAPETKAAHLSGATQMTLIDIAPQQKPKRQRRAR